MPGGWLGSRVFLIVGCGVWCSWWWACGRTAADSDIVAFEGPCEAFAEAQDASLQLTWDVRSAGPGLYTRISHAAVGLPDPDRVVIIGGIEYESAQPVVVNTTLVYDPASDAFARPTEQVLSSVAPPKKPTRTVDEPFVSPASRVEHAAFAAPSGAIFVFGGQTKEIVGDAWRLCVARDGTTAQWDQLVVAPTDTRSLAAAPAPRVGHSFTLLQTNASMVMAVIYGGLSADYVEFAPPDTSLHLALLPLTVPASTPCGDRSPRLLWRRPRLAATSPVPGARAYHSAVSVPAVGSRRGVRCLVIFGGKNTGENRLLGDLWRLCPIEDDTSGVGPPSTGLEDLLFAWEELVPVATGRTPGPRFGAAVTVAAGGLVVLIGGSATFPTDFLGDAWALDLNATQWLALGFAGDLVPPRRGHSVTYLAPPTQPPLLVVFGGKDRYQVVATRVEVAGGFVAPSCPRGRAITACDRDPTGMTYVCVPCPRGAFLEDGARRCRACAPGTYADVPGAASACAPCPAGAYNPLAGQSDPGACVPCAIGTASAIPGASTATTCGLCPVGTFAPAPGATTCRSCAPGTYANATGSGGCRQCPRGQWSPEAAAGCAPCPAGTYNPRLGSPRCWPCPWGTTSDAGAERCRPCPAQTYSPTLGPEALAASGGGCRACPALAWTGTSGGATSCRYCAPGSSWDARVGACVPCPVGTFADPRVTAGACAPCPEHTYAPTPGASACTPCPVGTRTASTGAATSTACGPCADPREVVDALSGACVACPAGTVVREHRCVTCTPGSYRARPTVPLAVVADDDDPSVCAPCPAMAVAPNRGADACASCADGAFAMGGGWGTCIPCAAAWRGTCPMGRSGAPCSGRGHCRFRGCVCDAGWRGGDCSVPDPGTSTSANGGDPAVLYFAEPREGRLLRTRLGPTTFTVRVARAGPLDGTLRARIVAGSGNCTSVPTTPVLPRAVELASGARETTLTFSTAAFSAGTVGSGCRRLVLRLEDVDAPTTSIISQDSDNALGLWLDAENGGPDAGSDSAVPRVLTAHYRLVRVADDGQLDTVALEMPAPVALDRDRQSHLELVPDGATPGAAGTITSLGELPVHVRVALDARLGTAAQELIDLLPAGLAAIESQYPRAAAVRVGWLPVLANDSDPLSYRPLHEVMALATNAITAGLTTGLTWSGIESMLRRTTSTSSAAAAALERGDRGLRRFLLVLGTLANLNQAGTAASVATVARAQSTWVLVVTPPSMDNADAPSPLPSLQVLALATIDEFPERLTKALREADAAMIAGSAPPMIVDDPLGLVVQSSDSPSVRLDAPSSGLLPTLRVDLRPLPIHVNASSLLLGIPGFAPFNMTLVAPGPSCVAPPPLSSTVAEAPALGGWIDPWHAMTLDEIIGRWLPPTASPTPTLRLYTDDSLLRTTRTAVLAITAPDGATEATLVRVFPGGDIAVGLDLVLRGFVRHAGADPTAPGPACRLGLTLTPAVVVEPSSGTAPTPAPAPVAAVKEEAAVAPTMGGAAWSHLVLSTRVPWEVANVTVTLRCPLSTTPGLTATRTVEWTDVGLFPDPALACQCPRGMFYKDGDCVRCPAGSFCAAGIRRPCPRGFFSFGRADHCERCRPGWICVDGLARLCDPGTFVSGAGACVSCPGGAACRNGLRVTCPVGTFAPGQAADCRPCPPGTISTTEGSSTCQLCGVATSSQYQRDHCSPCHAGQNTTSPGRHPCGSCAATMFPPSKREPEVCLVNPP